jgi:hypothetical protein
VREFELYIESTRLHFWLGNIFLGYGDLSWVEQTIIREYWNSKASTRIFFIACHFNHMQPLSHFACDQPCTHSSIICSSYWDI